MEYTPSDKQRTDERIRSISWSTAWFSIDLDFGVTLRCAPDEFDLPVLRRGWGIVFGFGPRNKESRRIFKIPYFQTGHPLYEKERKYWTDLRDLFEKNTHDIDAGLRKHPAMMTFAERHRATAQVARKMKFSSAFVQNITTPMALRALESGGTVLNEWGDELRLEEKEKKSLNRGEFHRLRLEWKENPIPPPMLSRGDLESVMEKSRGESE